MRRMWAAGAAIVTCLALGGLPVRGQAAITEPIAAATASPTRTPPSVVVTSGCPVPVVQPGPVPGTLDVYAPSEAGPWPVVVMFLGVRHLEGLSEHARRVADLGFVVFDAVLGRLAEGSDDTPTYEWFVANNAQGACAVEFARAHAAEYGGDPATMIVFGHSAGAHLGGDGHLRPARALGGLSGGSPARPDRRPGHLGGQLAALGELPRLGRMLSPPTRGSWTSSHRGPTSPSAGTKRS